MSGIHVRGHDGRRPLAAALLVAASLCLSGDAAAEKQVRLGRDVIPTFQSVRLSFDPDKPDYTGLVACDLEVRNATQEFLLHASGLTIGQLSLTRNGTPVAVRHELRPEDGLLAVQSEAPLPPGLFRLEIAFTNTFGTQAISLYRMDTGGEGYVFSQFQPDDAREAFPCWDEPGFKIPWQLTLDIPAGDQAVTNTPAESEEMNGATKTIVYRKTPPLPSYLVAVAAGPFEFISVPGTSAPTRIVTVAGQGRLAEHAAEVTPGLLAGVESWFGEPYPYEKLDIIAIPEYWPGAMENPGAVTFSDVILLIDRGAGVAEKRNLARIMAHELAHMWFGDMVTMTWWDDLWLSESFADWMGDKITERVHPGYRLAASELLNSQNTMRGDSRPSAIAIRQPVEHSSDALHNVGLAYNKGKRVLSMFEEWIGEDIFRRGVLDYIAAHRWGSAEAKDLWDALSRVSKKDVGSVMATFVEQPGMPLLSMEIVKEEHIRIRQKRFSTAGVKPPETLWQVPVGMRFSNGVSVETHALLLGREETSFDAGLWNSDAWVLPNLNARGYYRWTLPPPLMLRLATVASEKLTVLERIELIANAGALLDAGLMTGPTYLDVLAAFAGDKDPMVMTAVLDGLGRVRNTFVTDDLREGFAAYVQALLRPSLDRIGLARKQDENDAVALLRPGLLSWLGRSGGDSEILQYARYGADRFIENPDLLDPSTSGIVLQLAALDGDRALFDGYRKGFETTPNPGDRRRFLQALGNFRDPALQDEALRYTLEGPLRSSEILVIPGNLNALSEMASERTYRWALDNYAAIVGRMPPEIVAYMPSVMGGCSESRLAEGTAFFNDPAHSVPGTDRQIRQVTDQVTECATLRRREGAAVADYLTHYLNNRGD